MTEHIWTDENLHAFVTGSLSAEERGRVARHLGECGECQAEFDDISALERRLQGACLAVRPDAGLEDRAIQRLRLAPRRRPNWVRFALSAAAVIVFGLIGLAVQALALEGVLPLPGMEVAPKSHTRTFFGGLYGYDPDVIEGMKRTGTRSGSVVKPSAAIAANEEPVDRKVDSLMKIGAGNGIDAKNEPLVLDISQGKPLRTDQDGMSGLKNADQETKESFYDRGGEAEKGEKDKAVLLRDVATISESTKKPAADREYGGNAVGTRLQGSFYGRSLGPGDGLSGGGKGFSGPKGPVASTGSGGGAGPGGGPGGGEITALKKDVWGHIPENKRPGGLLGLVNNPVGAMLGTGGGAGTATSTPGFGMFSQQAPVTEPTLVAGLNPYYFLPTTPPPVALSAPTTFGKGQGGAVENIGNVGGQKKEEPAPQAKEKAAPAPQAPAPEKIGRMIIRTGEMEFETDSFDNAVQTIAKLITGVQGGFIATINSDKLPNGKTKGSVVVRMPPTKLDQFIFDLRRDLAKSSELKNQRLGSLDVTKQYTDIESRLRAARAIEERLINIIKNGKGEVKDLIVAEKELAVWRTKIEEMEGEIRYYANQVSLSTLTITLTEKEIQAPTAIVVTEMVAIRIEADEVGKAHQAAMKAVEDLKGRITRSDLKQHTAGQFISTLSAEIPPAKKDAFIAELKKLGVVSDFQENQRQTMEGGSGKAPELKPKTSDVHFDITIHNTANIRPRLSTDLKVATTDVPAAYTKLLDLITKVKGQVRDGKVNEQDYRNIHAVLDFNVPTDQKPAIDKFLDAIGPVLERTNIRAPISEVSTQAKFGYTVLLRDIAWVPAKQGLVEIIAVNDVVTSYARLQDAIAKAKGQVRFAKLDEQKKFAITAELDFAVPSDERAGLEKLLDEMGTLLSRSNLNAPDNQLATATKFGFAVILRDIANIQPAHAADVKIAAADVPGSYARLVDAVSKAQGQIRTAQLNEQEKPKTTALLQFTIAVADKLAMDKLLGELGVVLARDNTQAPANELTTANKFGYSVALRDLGTVPPREVIAVKQEVKDVEARIAEISGIVVAGKGRVVDPPNVERTEAGQAVGIIRLEVPFGSRDVILKAIKGSNKFLSQKMVPNPQVPENEHTTAQIIVTLVDNPFVPNDQSLSSYVQSSLSMSLRMFSVCIMLIILGVSTVLPWVLLVWLAYRVYAKLAGSPAPSGEAPPSTPAAT